MAANFQFWPFSLKLKMRLVTRLIVILQNNFLLPAIYEKGLCNAFKALYQLQWKVNWLRSCLYQNICKICSAFKNNQSWFWQLYCQFLTYIVCLNGVTVAYCKVLVNNIIVTVSVLQGTNNIWLVLNVSFTMNGIGFWLQSGFSESF